MTKKYLQALQFIFLVLLFFIAVSGCQRNEVQPTQPASPATLDTVPPVITLSTADTINHPLNVAFTSPVATAMDDVDGNISANIAINGTVNFNQTGAYPLYYTVSDAAGNTDCDTLTVIVYNTAANMVGMYTCSENCTLTGSSVYSASVSASTTVNGGIGINNFGNFGFAFTIDGVVSGSSISFAGGQQLPAPGTFISGSGTITSFSPVAFTVNYSWTDGTSTESCVSQYQ